MAEDQIEAKRMKMDNVQELHFGEDPFSLNTNLCSSIIRRLYLDGKTADINFLFGTNDVERVPAHKLILSTGSNVFDTMFYGSLPEGDAVKIRNGNSSAFKEFLQFFYCDEITMTSDNIAQVIDYVRQYGIERCMTQCIDFLKDTMTNNDVCTCYQLAIQFDLDDLKRFCERKISANAEDVLDTDDFLNCDGTVLQHIIKMDSLMCGEEKVFDACIAWARNFCEKKGLDASEVKNLRAQLGGSVYLIHFQRMKFDDFASRKVNLQLFSMLEVADILQILVDKDFKSNLFTTNPLSYKIFTWDEKRILECSLSDKLSDGKSRKMNETNESFTLSCNQPFLLSKIKLTKVRSKSAAITFIIIARIVFELFQCKINFGGRATVKSLFRRDIVVNSGGDVFIEFANPILIHPKRSYKILMECNNTFYPFDIPKMNHGTIEFGDLKINFLTNDLRTDNCGLVSAM